MKLIEACTSLLLIATLVSFAAAQAGAQDPVFKMLSKDQKVRLATLNELRSSWKDSYAVKLLEASRFIRVPETRTAIFDLLNEKTGQSFGQDRNSWYRWVWSNPYQHESEYAAFKSKLYSRVDSRFAEYFSAGAAAEIRLDEIRWGGVKRDGIPPLDHPKVLPASRAEYLADSDIVFGVELGGQARAYPKRILAWHEMVRDRVGGREINGVYCTLCGSMIVYDPIFQGDFYELGTSGFLYRSNKLMYDKRTKSLWSTLEGKPVVGELVGKGIKLDSLYVVTTTWGAWKKMHPNTDVLSLNTGFRRDYGEGVAYAKYFSTDALMFTVPKLDQRLKNKAPVLVLRFGDDKLAIAKSFLRNNPVYQSESGGTNFVAITNSAGATRVYDAGDIQFKELLDDGRIKASSGEVYQVTEESLVSSAASATILRRLPTHEAFWFGWYSAHPDTKLIK